MKVEIQSLDTEGVSTAQRVLDRVRPKWSEHRGGAAYLETEWAQSPPLIEFSGQSDDLVGFLGTFDGFAVGVGLLRREHHRAVVEVIAVESDFRAVGVGDALMHAMVRQAKQWDVNSIESAALPGDRDTKNFFEAFGLKARLLIVACSVDDIEPDDDHSPKPD